MSVILSLPLPAGLPEVGNPVKAQNFMTAFRYQLSAVSSLHSSLIKPNRIKQSKRSLHRYFTNFADQYIKPN